MKITHIVLHTAAHALHGPARDTSAHEIDAWHRAEGWSGIGYHNVVRFDGTIEQGRRYGEQGAHVGSLNHRSIGICCSGNGDYADWTDRQKQAAQMLVAVLCIRYGIPVIQNPKRVLGHREINDLAKVWRWVKRTSKTCPGRLVDMTEFRRGVVEKVATLQRIEYAPYLREITNDVMAGNRLGQDVDRWNGVAENMGAFEA